MSRKVLYVIAPERFRDEELAIPRAALIAAGHLVTVASTRPGPASGMLGAREQVAATVGQAAATGWDCVVIAGGAGAPDHLWDHAPLRDLVRAVHCASRPVAAICLAPPVLARAGILAGCRATTFPAPRAIIELKRGGAVLVDEPVVVDGAVVTGRGPEAAAAFAAAILNLLES